MQIPSFPFLGDKPSKNRQGRLVSQLEIELRSRRSNAVRQQLLFDKETGFLAPWYFRVRAAEECLRTLRYGRPLSLLVLTPAIQERLKLNGWLAATARSTDLVCRDIDNRYLLLLVETNEVGAASLAKRVMATIRLEAISILGFPGDEERFRQVISPSVEAWLNEA